MLEALDLIVTALVGEAPPWLFRAEPHRGVGDAFMMNTQRHRCGTGTNRA
jgi:hypothetical protein